MGQLIWRIDNFKRDRLMETNVASANDREAALPEAEYPNAEAPIKFSELVNVQWKRHTIALQVLNESAESLRDQGASHN